MIQDVAGQIIGQFAKNLSAKIEADQPGAALDCTEAGGTAAETASAAQKAPPQPAAPAQMGGMAFRVLWNQIVRSVKSLFGVKS